MDVSIGTFNLNNLFGRWNLYVDAPAPPPTGAPAVAVPAAANVPAATQPDRAWLEAAPAMNRGAAAPRKGLPDVKIIIEGTLTEAGVKWRTNPYDGRLVFKKKPEATAKLAARIKALDVDVLAVQEVENIESLDEFVETQGLAKAGYENIVLVEGNDDRLIDVGLISRLPVGAVSSWRHRTYKNGRGNPVFSRDLLEVDILDATRKHVVLTLYVNHLKSRLARNDAQRRAGDERRKRQAETIAAIIAERKPPAPYVILGDMNDSPTASRLKAIREMGVVNALADPDETGGPYPADDPTPPTTKAWTHRYRADGRTDYELFDQIWLSPDLRKKQIGAWIQRRTSRGGDASDHDPAAIKLRL